MFLAMARFWSGFLLSVHAFMFYTSYYVAHELYFSLRVFSILSDYKTNSPLWDNDLKFAVKSRGVIDRKNTRLNSSHSH